MEPSLEELELQHVLDRNRCGSRERRSLACPWRATTLFLSGSFRLRSACRNELKQVAAKAGRGWLAPTATTEQGTEQVGGGASARGLQTCMALP